MRISRIIHRLPESTFLQVINLVGCAVTATGFLAVGINNLPVFTRDFLSFLIQHIKLRNGGNVGIIKRRQPFQTEVTSFRNRNFHFLPTVTWFESTGRYRCFLLQFDGLPLFTMRFRNSHTKHIQDRFVQSDDGCLFRAFQVKNDDFIHSFFQPAARHEQGLLRTDFPETSHGMTVHPYHTFSPRLHVQERISHLIQGKSSAIVGRNTFIIFLYATGGRRVHILKVPGRYKFIIYGKIINSPAFQRFGILTVHQFHFLGNSLAVVNGLVKVHTPHGFHQ